MSKEEKLRLETEAKAKKEAEEQGRREADEKAKQEAEEKARIEAEKNAKNKTIIKFITPYGRYSANDIAGFDANYAKELVEQRKVAEYLK